MAAPSIAERHKVWLARGSKLQCGAQQLACRAGISHQHARSAAAKLCRVRQHHDGFTLQGVMVGAALPDQWLVLVVGEPAAGVIISSASTPTKLALCFDEAIAAADAAAAAAAAAHAFKLMASLYHPSWQRQCQAYTPIQPPR